MLRCQTTIVNQRTEELDDLSPNAVQLPVNTALRRSLAARKPSA